MRAYAVRPMDSAGFKKLDRSEYKQFWARVTDRVECVFVGWALPALEVRGVGVYVSAAVHLSPLHHPQLHTSWLNHAPIHLSRWLKLSLEMPQTEIQVFKKPDWSRDWSMEWFTD